MEEERLLAVRILALISIYDGPLLTRAELSYQILLAVYLYPFEIEFKFSLPQQRLSVSSARVLHRKTGKVFFTFISESFQKEEGEDKVKTVKKISVQRK